MSKLKEYRRLEQQLNTQLERLEALGNDKRLLEEIAFEKKLQILLDRYRIKKDELVNLLGLSLGCTGNSVGEERTSCTMNGRQSRKSGKSRC